MPADTAEFDPSEPASPRSTLVGSAATHHDRRVPLFPSEPEVPRRRRPYDVARLVVMTAFFVFMGWAASKDPDLDARIRDLFSSLPGWMRSLAWFAYSTSAIASLVLVFASISAGRARRGLARDLVCALVFASLVALLAGHLATGVWPDVVPEFVSIGERLSYPTLRPTLVLIVILVLGPYVNAQVQRAMRAMMAATTIAPIVLGVATLSGMLGAIALASASVAAVRLAFGSPEGLPKLDRLRELLARIGVEVDDLAYAPDQPGTVGLATGTSADGRALDVKIYSVDASSRQRAERVWRALWYRRAGPSARAGRVEQAQHEALAILTARDAGVDAPALVGVGQDANGDVMLITVAATGTPLDDLADPTDDDLATLWTALDTLHTEARLAHGSISPETVLLRESGAQFVDLGDASLLPTEQQLATDLVSMLATHALVVGPDRAVDVAASAIDRDRLVAALPYCQDPALEPELRRRLKDTDADADDLRERLADRLEIEEPEPAPIRRVSWSNVFIAVAAIFAANALISQIADVGFDTLVEELKGASVGWLVVAFFIGLSSSATAYIGLHAVVGRPLPWLPTALLQLAKKFVGLVVPSMVGRVGLDIRFLQKQGVPVAVASTQGPVIGFVGFLAEVVLLLLSAWSIGQAIELSELDDFDAGGLISIAVLVVVVGLVVLVAVPALRSRVVPFVRDVLSTVGSIVTSPGILLRIFTSEALDRLIGALALGATVAAFGAELPFAALVFVSVGTGLLAGLAPVPGGIGVAEATMTGLLTACGLPAEQAVSIAIVHRLVTAYLPPVVGFFAFNWLKQDGYL